MNPLQPPALHPPSLSQYPPPVKAPQLGNNGPPQPPMQPPGFPSGLPVPNFMNKPHPAYMGGPPPPMMNQQQGGMGMAPPHPPPSFMGQLPVMMPGGQMVTPQPQVVPNPQLSQLAPPNAPKPEEKTEKKLGNEQWRKLWVGNIPSELPDSDLQKLLSKCGQVVSWKRTKDAKGNSTTFGFIEYTQIEAVLKCMRVLQNFEILEDEPMKIKPSEQTQQFLNQWLDVKSNTWQHKSEEDKLGYATFTEFLEKDDNSCKDDIDELMKDLDVKLQVLRKERQREEERKEHPREREREMKKRQHAKDLQRRSEHKIEDWLEHEDYKRRQKRKEKEREKEKQLYLKKILEKQINMDSDDEKDFFQHKYKSRDRIRFRQEQLEEDEEQKLKEIAKQAPPEVNIQALIPKHTEEMEEEVQKPKVYQQSFKMQEILLQPNSERQSQIAINPERQNNLMNPERSQMIGGNNINNGQQHQQQQQQQQNIQGFGMDEEEDNDQQVQQKHHLPVPGKMTYQKQVAQPVAPVLTQQQQDQKQQDLDQEKQKADMELKLQLQSIIKEIPKDKKQLFAYQFDWQQLAKGEILEKKVRPWLIQKSKEYLNEEELNFVKMVIKKLNNQESAENILKKVEIILEEDAEEFIVKLWRMLVFEMLKLARGIVL